MARSLSRRRSRLERTTTSRLCLIRAASMREVLARRNASSVRALAGERGGILGALKSCLIPILWLLAAEAAAQPALVRECANCHGSGGEGGLTGAPRLAGLAQTYLEQQLAAYANGSRQQAVMTPIARALTAGEREAITAYYAGLRAPATPPQVGARHRATTRAGL
jgi:cytochrome c553